MKRTLPLAVLSCMVCAATARAEDTPELPVDVHILEMVNLPKESPRITVSANERVAQVQISVREGGRRVAGRSVRGFGPGNDQTLSWRAQPGVHTYTVTVSGRSAKGPATAAIDAVVTVMRPLEVVLRRDQVDLEERTLAFSLNNPAGRTVLIVRAASGKVLYEGTTDLTGRPAGTRLTLQWPALDEAIARMELRIHDASDSWSDFELVPFSIEIPHDDVVFDTAAYAIAESEVPKLQAAYDAILDAIREHGSDLRARLYVLGHTDTVGTPADNQALSRQRAIAIAEWFARRGGISLPILAQGFGETQLLVKTADNVDEPKNRRAQYVLAAQAPAATEWTTVSTGRAPR